LRARGAAPGAELPGADAVPRANGGGAMMRPGPSSQRGLVKQLGALLVCLVVVAALLVWLAGTANPVTPAGYVGYVTRGAVLGKSEFVALQNGPTSTGRGWLLHVVNVSITPYTFDEEFEGQDSVLTQDNLKVSFRVHTIFKIRADRVKEFVEQYSTLHEGEDPNRVVRIAYENFLKERLRTFARDEVEKVNGYDLKGRIGPMGDALLANVKKLTDPTPFDVESVVVGNIQYPDSISNAVATKLAAQQKLEQMATEVQIEQKKKDQRVVEAEGIAKSMEIINAKLTPEYLQYLAIDAQKQMVGSPNHTVVYIPVGNMGVPLVGTLPAPGGEAAAPTKPK
jgi:regulator of protease activity HflC (stomatin/prohibitin superfamily)